MPVQVISRMLWQFDQACCLIVVNPQGAAPCRDQPVKEVVPSGLKVTQAAERIPVQQDGYVIMRFALLSVLPRPDIPHVTVVGMTGLQAGPVPVVPDPGLEGSHEPTHHVTLPMGLAD